MIPPLHRCSATRWTLPLAFAAVLAGASAARANPEPPPPAEDRPISPRRLRAAMQRYAHEPSVGQIVRAALDASDADPERTRQASKRARRAGWVPSVSFGVRHGQARDLYERQVAGSDDRTGLSTDDELRLDARLTFDLGKIVFRRDEVRLLREQKALRRERAELIEKVVGLYYERRRLQLERDLLQRRSVERALRIAEVEALLDAYTDGAFARHRKSRRQQRRRD